ncbi:hypothetical protein JAAARDRAFT_27741 [Jaapia argillacea MUCL 33604]|uniref:Protein kinase domain-containing protein n=1 Tax=Jaapia argillacea MUCL 33604 TaxID=933084 RepID=A0A067QAM9_9AGAM|nr:hypothetical protein JAAARDRAFT_27741 [Jaapia argillacea MUCL 33604]
MNGTELPAHARLSPSTAHRYAIAAEKGTWDLDTVEKKWRDRQSYLASRGYMLRPRYRPGWTPSWFGTDVDPFYCEDAIRQLLPQILDATRLDRTVVCLKRTKVHSLETEIARFLTSDSHQRDPKNHCVPILDTFSDPLEPGRAFIVMPLLRPFDDPEFAHIGEVLDFVGQTLEGIGFIHKMGVAHRDCADQNIMMDARTLYPRGWHPIRTNCGPDGVRELPPAARIDCPVRYYFIDFGLATRFLPGDSCEVVGAKGRDQDVPELSNTIPYDPFKVDIFILGHLYQTDFHDKYLGLDFLLPLIRAMTNEDPNQRPTAQAAFNSFQSVYLSISTATSRARLRRRDEPVHERIYNSMRRLVGQ